MKVIEVQVSDEAAEMFAQQMRAQDEWPWVACIEILVRDRKRMRDTLDAIIAMPNDYDLMTNAMAKAMHYVAFFGKGQGPT